MKNKLIPLIKSTLILALAALAVFQVYRLWLVDLTNRNFGLYLQARFPPAAPDGQGAFARPYRVISGAGDGAFLVIYSGIEESEEWAFGERALDAVLHRGVFRQVSELPLNEPVLIFEYAFDMCTEKFAQALGRRSDLLTDVGLDKFTGVAVVPPEVDGFALRVFFIGEEIWEFMHVGDGFGFDIETVDAQRKHFVNRGYGFVPHTPLSGLSYTAVVVQNPLQNPHGIFTLSHMRSEVAHFFDNPATIIPGVTLDNLYTFSNRNTMIRYLENSVLEYISYRAVGRASDNFFADFSAALAFITNDTGVINEIFLRQHEPLGRAHIFWFDYVIDNRPLVLAEEWRTGPRCNDPLYSAIEVTVEHGRVVRYRRLAYNFVSDGLVWMDAAEFERDGYFTLGFPLGSGPILELAVMH
ncbi:MAG: hypothetical protein FWF78_02915 [Defluviitaleaceae bacterium]|nr:hypothetical protein [Defluviitaleaceae bacterium]